MSVVIETTLGDITVDLYLQERPKTCLNFIKLCRLKYYNFNLFHTIQQGFIAQTGDPSGTGDEGSSIWGVLEGNNKRFFEAEIIPKIRHTEPGLLSMVSTGKNMVGSQFFFTLGSDLLSLDGIHCVIGEIVEGHDILRKINEAICDDTYRPYQDIRITHTVVLEDPFDNPRGFKEPSRSPSPSAERLKNGKIAADEDIDDTEGKTDLEIQEMLAEREAKARATILEIVGDLPDAEMAPPENVLFVCKLNPTTNDDDLEIIFSRFGKIKTCEVIRDKVTGDSLQYAFVEFEEKKSCEDAYFKMDNVLIDDRRIHVDFSQSVAKIKWKGKGRIEYEDDREKNKKIDFEKRGRHQNSRNERANFNQRQSYRDHDRYKDRTKYDNQREEPRNLSRGNDERRNERNYEKYNRINNDKNYEKSNRNKDERQSDRLNRDNKNDEYEDRRRVNERRDRFVDKRRRSLTPERGYRRRDDKYNTSSDYSHSRTGLKTDERYGKPDRIEVSPRRKRSKSPQHKNKITSDRFKSKNKTSKKSKKDSKKKKKRKRSTSSESSSSTSSSSSSSD